MRRFLLYAAGKIMYNGKSENKPAPPAREGWYIMARGGFPGMMGGGNMQQLARQAQKLQQQMAKMQEEIEAREFEATAGGGMATAKVNGKKELISIEIKPEAVDPDDVEMLQDLIVAAVNEALRQANDAMEQGMGKMTGGMGLPGLF